MNALKWGLVGYGEQAKRMASALKQLKNVEITAVCCSSEDRAKAWEKEFGLESYGKLSDFLDNAQTDVIYIASPHHLHTPQAFKAIEEGKNVLVEKPMALSVDGVHKLIDAAAKNKVTLGVNFPLRQHPGLQELKNEITSRGLGDIIQVYVHLSRKTYQGQGWWRDQFHAGPMCLMDLGVQGIDLLLWLAGARALEVATVGRGGKDDQTLNIASLISMTLTDSGQGLVSSNNYALGDPNFVFLQGTEKAALIELNWPEGDGSLKVRKLKAGSQEEKAYPPIDLLKACAQNFIAAVQGKAKFTPCCEETYPVVEATCAAIESLKSGKSVKAGEIQRISGARF